MQKVKRGQLIIRQGDSMAGVYFLYSGKVKVFLDGAKDQEQIVRLTRKSEIIGHRGFGGKPQYPVSISALEESVVCFIEKDLFLEILDTNPELTKKMMFFFAEELRRSEHLMRKMARLSTTEKIADAILHLADAFGFEADGKTLDISITRIDLASLAGTVPEVTSRTLANMQKENLVDLGVKKINI